MIAVIQRVSRGEVRVEGRSVGAIGRGLLVLVGVGRGDDESDARWLARKTAQVRIFSDEEERMNLSVQNVQGAVLAVSQFTLHGDLRKGRRPSFTGAAPPETGARLYQAYVQALREEGVPVQTGEFGAMMDVEMVNQGPVTLIIKSPSEER